MKLVPGTLSISSSPHAYCGNNTRRIMLDVCIALLPALVGAIWFFGWRCLTVVMVSVASCVFFEWAYRRLMKKDNTCGDLSAVVTGILLAFVCPPTIPYWVVILGALFAIVLVKQIFGGIGQNFVNPALAARAILMTSWVGRMSGSAYNLTVRGIDAVTSSTPLAADGSYTLLQLFLGQCAGCIGEVSKLAILIGGVYLIARKIISAKIPVLMLLTMFVAMWIYKGSANEALYQLLSGGLFLGAFFMATDYVTSPVTPLGRIFFGIGCGVVAFVIRSFSSMPEGVSYAILIMNLTVPLIDRFTKPRIYGEAKKHA